MAAPQNIIINFNLFIMRTEIDFAQYRGDMVVDELSEFNELKLKDLKDELEVMENIAEGHAERQVHFAMRCARFADSSGSIKYYMALRDYHNRQRAWAASQVARIYKEMDAYENAIRNTVINQ